MLFASTGPAASIGSLNRTRTPHAASGLEHIPAYSLQARGRSERLNRTFQDRLVNELRVAGIRSLEAANAYLSGTFLPQHNATFGRVARDPASAFVPVGNVDLDAILCHDEERIVARDNTVTLQYQRLQISAQPGRRSCVGLQVTVRRHLNGHYSVKRGTQTLGTFGIDGQPLTVTGPAPRSSRRSTAQDAPGTTIDTPRRARHHDSSPISLDIVRNGR